LRGGRLIYIKVIGHDLMATGNRVFVGNYPCIIPADGVTDTFISCETTDSGSTSDINNLKVTLISFGITTISQSPNLVHYVGSRTSQLAEIFPTSNFGNQGQSYLGIHRLLSLGDGRDMGDIIGLKIGN